MDFQPDGAEGAAGVRLGSDVVEGARLGKPGTRSDGELGMLPAAADWSWRLGLLAWWPWLRQLRPPGAHDMTQHAQHTYSTNLQLRCVVRIYAYRATGAKCNACQVPKLWTSPGSHQRSACQ